MEQYPGRILLIATLTFVPAFGDDQPPAAAPTVTVIRDADARVQTIDVNSVDKHFCGDCGVSQRPSRKPLLGWQLSQRWSLGRHRHGDRSVGLIWRERNAQVTLNHDGIRWSRRF